MLCHRRHDHIVRAPPVYRPMIATSGAGRLRGEWAAEPKLDGWRAIVTVDPSLARGFDVRSRNGWSLTTSVPELRSMADIGVRTLLDGRVGRRGRRQHRRLCTRPANDHETLDAPARSRSPRSMSCGSMASTAIWVPGVRTGSWRKIKTAAWRADHAPRRLPTAIRERIAAAELAAVAPPKDLGA